MARVDSLASIVVAVSAAAMAITYAARPATRNVGAPTEPVFIERWREIASEARIIGDTNSPIKVVVFTDFECPFCAKFHTTVKSVASAYRGKLAVAVRHLPLRGHASAWPAARAAECAGEQNRFSPLVDLMYEKRDSLGSKPWAQFALDAGVPDRARFDKCISSGSPVPRIDRDTALARELKVMATPTTIVNGWRLPSTPDSASLAAVVDSLLAGRKPFPRRRLLGIF